MVLPFRDLSADQSQEFFCEAISERLTSRLGGLGGVQTVAHTTALQFTDKPDDVRSIGVDLQVDGLLQGSVQRSGRRIRVTASLSRTSDGLNVWQETYDRRLRDVLTLQDDLAESIAASLQNSIVPGSAPVRDPAKRFYRLGMCRFVRGRHSDLDLAVDAFRRSVKADPDFTSAQARLASCLVLKMLYTDGPVETTAAKAREAALLAAEGPDSGIALAALGAVEAHFDRNWESAEKRFLQALNVDPKAALSHDWYGTCCLLPVRRFSDALSQARIALNLDPTSAWTNVDLAWTCYMAGSYEEAIGQAQMVLEFEPRSRNAHWILGRSQLGLGRIEAALETLQWTGDVGRNAYRLGTLGRCYALAGRIGEARDLLDELRGRSRPPAYAIAEIYLGLGESERTLEWLERSIPGDARFLNWAAADPVFLNLQGVPRFRNLLERLGLAPQDDVERVPQISQDAATGG